MKLQIKESVGIIYHFINHTTKALIISLVDKSFLIIYLVRRRRSSSTWKKQL